MEIVNKLVTSLTRKIDNAKHDKQKKKKSALKKMNAFTLADKYEFLNDDGLDSDHNSINSLQEADLVINKKNSQIKAVIDNTKPYIARVKSEEVLIKSEKVAIESEKLGN